MSEVPLRRLAGVEYGLGQPPPLADDGVPIIRATNIERGRIVPQDLIYAALDDLPLDRAPLLTAGEILVVRSGAYTADSALVTPEWEGAAPGYDLRVTPGEASEPRFLAYSLLSRRCLEAMWVASSRAAQPHLNAEELGEVPIADLPLERQRAIAQFLDTETARIDALIAKKRQLIGLLDAHLVAARERLLCERADVVATPLMHLTDPYRPIVYGIVQAGPEVPDGVPYIKTGDMADLDPERLSRTSVAIDEQYRRARVRPGDIVIAMRASIGLAVLVPPELPGANLTQGTARIAPADGVDVRWLLHALRTRVVREQCDVRAVGTTFKTLNIWDLRRIQVPTPPASIQTRLASEVDRVDDQLSTAVVRLSRQIELLQEHRRALITAAVTGELEVPGMVA